MKFIHCADIHLGSKMEAKLPKEKADERKIELRTAFNRMVEYAVKNEIGLILLSGDVFDSDRPLKKDKEFFYSVVKNNPKIDFLYVRGNHDILESYTERPENLKTFGTEWTAYRYGDVVVSGIESADDNATAMYAALKLKKTDVNIVMLHGQTTEGNKTGKFVVNLPKLRGKNIDYLALGHVHAYADGELDERGKYVYSGCLEGRGFDELGEKGFVEVDTYGGVTYKFVKNSLRIVDEATVDVSDAADMFEACKKAKAEAKTAKKNMLRVILTGDIAYDNDGMAKELEKQMAHDCYFVSVKDKTLRKFDAEALAGDISLRGEFIRTVLGNADYTDEQKQRIISVGLKALGGVEVE